MLTMLRRIFNLLVRSEALRYGTVPTSADGAAAVAVTLTANAAAWTWGAYGQLIASTDAETLVVGVNIENQVGAPGQGEIAIASGAAAAETELIRVAAVAGYVALPFPVRVANAVRLAARYRVSTGAADTADVKLHTLTRF